MNGISVIIPVLKDFVGLKRTVQSLSRSYKDPDEIIVVNDGADPGINEIQVCFPELKIKLLDVPESKGSYHARNLGFAKAENEFILFADAGLLFPDNTLARIRSLLMKHDYVAANVGVEKEETESLAAKYYRLTAFPIEDMFRRYHAGGAGFLAVRSSVLREAGGFNATLYSGADNEFGMRVQQHGFSGHFEKDLIASHPSRNWRSQFRVLLRIYKGRKMLSKLDPDRYGHMDFTVRHLLLFPFQSLRSIAGAAQDRKELFGPDLNLAEVLAASSIHHILVFWAMFFILIFPKKNFNLR